MQMAAGKMIEKQENIIQIKKAFWPMLIVFYALFVVRDVFAVQFPVFIYLVWVAVMALYFNDTEIKALLISFMPLASGFQSKYAILICMIVLLIKYGKSLRIPPFIFIILFLMFWEFVHLDGQYSTTAEYLSGFAPLMCLCIIVSLPAKQEDVTFFSRVLAVSLVVGSLILLVNTVKSGQQSIISLVKDGFRLGDLEETESHQIVYNANGLGSLCNMAIVGLLLNIYVKKSKKIDYFLIVFSVLMGCLTVSRTFLLCLAVTFILYILLQEKSFAHKLKVLLIIVFLVIVAIVCLKTWAPAIIDNYVERFNADDVTGGRSYLLTFYNKFIASSPERFWYGIGVQNINLKVGDITGVTVDAPHNGYQQLIIAWGVFGLFFTMLFVLCIVLDARNKNPHAALMGYIPLFLVLINTTAGQFITSGTKLLSLVYIYLVICNVQKERKKSNGNKHY